MAARRPIDRDPREGRTALRHKRLNARFVFEAVSDGNKPHDGEERITYASIL